METLLIKFAASPQPLSLSLPIIPLLIIILIIILTLLICCLLLLLLIVCIVIIVIIVIMITVIIIIIIISLLSFNIIWVYDAASTRSYLQHMQTKYGLAEYIHACVICRKRQMIRVATR